MELKHRVQASYLVVVVIWSTTPLAIQWSGRDVGYLFGVSARMAIGLAVCLISLPLLGLSFKWTDQARKTYLAAGLGIYGAMLLVYWGAQHIPSGWISVLFGLTPILTGAMAHRFLDESKLGGLRLLGIVMGIIGLVVVFYGSLKISPQAWQGVLAVLLAVVLHSISLVRTKYLAYQAHGLVITAGGLMVAVPLYMLTWIATDAHWPEQIPLKSAWSIVYLGVIATVIGFGAYFYVLRHVDATRVALLTFMTPVLALWLGHWLNQETLSWSVITGTLLILSGLIIFEYAERKKSFFKQLLAWGPK